MKNKYLNSALMVFVIFFLSASAYAITPQQYCEKLHAASTTGQSFEVLNFDSYPTSYVYIKFCKNGRFFWQQATPNAWSEASVDAVQCYGVGCSVCSSRSILLNGKCN